LAGKNVCPTPYRKSLAKFASGSENAAYLDARNSKPHALPGGRSMSPIGRGFALVLCLAICGCSERDTSPNSAADLSDRFDALKAMSDGVEHDKIAEQLAKDASAAGNMNITRESVNLIKDDKLHDNAAYKSSLVWSKAGKRREAEALAQTIKNEALRPKAVDKARKGDSTE
jgi:hypothetical protein